MTVPYVQQHQQHDETHSTSQRVAIVGAGAAGISAAWSLSRYSHNHIDIYETQNKSGGVASTELIHMNYMNQKIDIRLNDGVQGGSNTYHNTLLLHQQIRKYREASIQQPPGQSNSIIQHNNELYQPVEMTISFGLKRNGTNWTNYLPEATNGPIIQQCTNDIRRFKYLLYIIQLFEYIYICMPTWLVLYVFQFSNAFKYYMVYPLTALFFGTGNQTPYISSALLSRVFLDSEFKLFDYDPHRLLSSKPHMFVFGELSMIYSELEKLIIQQNNAAQFLYNTTIEYIHRYDHTIAISSIDMNGIHTVRTYDHIILTCNTTSIIDMYGGQSQLTYAERVVLNNVQWFTDVTYTHTDHKYIEQFYTVNNSHQTDNYYIYSDVNDPNLLEMSFNLTNYQPELIKLKSQLGNQFNIYQTIYLNQANNRYWNINYLDKTKILSSKIWYQMSHTWRHFLFTVPLMRYINRYKPHGGSILYAGSWTMFNTHEIAVISGLCAAHRLGATYPFSDNQLANKQFDLYLNMIHGVNKHGSTPIIQLVLNIILLPVLWIGYVLINLVKLL